MHDLQMARGAVEGGYNLAVGEPVVLQKHLKFPKFEARGPFHYPTMLGEQVLLEELRVLHHKGEIVITTGAKQALAAAFHALRVLEGREVVVHRTPYWPSYPTIAKAEGLTFSTDLVRRSTSITVVTSPNNPDGGEYMGEYDIWDGVYAQWVYGWNRESPQHRIFIGSAAKLLGLSGVRLGWLVTKDPRIAAEARKYVELTTSGVSVLSQQYVAHAMKYMREKQKLTHQRLGKARDEMLKNGEAFKNEFSGVVRRCYGVPENGKGMFAYFKVWDAHIDRFSRALVDSKVSLVSGHACGETAIGYYRMNMAHDHEYTRNALRAIREKLTW